MPGFIPILNRKKNTERSLQMINNPSSAHKKEEKTTEFFDKNEINESPNKESKTNSLFKAYLGIQTPSEKTPREENYSFNTANRTISIKRKIEIVSSYGIQREGKKDSICEYTAITSGSWDTRFSIIDILRNTSSLEDIFADGRATPFEGRTSTPLLQVEN